MAAFSTYTRDPNKNHTLQCGFSHKRRFVDGAWDVDHVGRLSLKKGISRGISVKMADCRRSVHSEEYGRRMGSGQFTKRVGDASVRGPGRHEASAILSHVLELRCRVTMLRCVCSATHPFADNHPKKDSRARPSGPRPTELACVRGFRRSSGLSTRVPDG